MRKPVMKRDFPPCRATGLGAALLAAVLSGCIVHLPKYPREWSPLHSAVPPSCLDVTGQFQNLGEPSEQHGGPRRLTQILFPRNKELDAAPTVHIEFSGGALEAVATLPDGATYRSVLKDAAKCAPRRRDLEDPNNPGSVDKEGIAGLMHTSLELFRAEDGSLVVRTTERDLVIALLIPAGVDVKYWIRFPRRELQAP
jgi:hypothetical protein